MIAPRTPWIDPQVPEADVPVAQPGGVQPGERVDQLAADGRDDPERRLDAPVEQVRERDEPRLKQRHHVAESGQRSEVTRSKGHTKAGCGPAPLDQPRDRLAHLLVARARAVPLHRERRAVEPGRVDDALAALADPLPHGQRGPGALHPQHLSRLYQSVHMDHLPSARYQPREPRWGPDSSAIVVSSPLPSDDAQRSRPAGHLLSNHPLSRPAASSARSRPTPGCQGSAAWALP